MFETYFIDNICEHILSVTYFIRSAALRIYSQILPIKYVRTLSAASASELFPMKDATHKVQSSKLMRDKEANAKENTHLHLEIN